MPKLSKNPKRVAAGRANRAKRKPLSAESREKLRQAIRRNKPWLNSTGPVTEKGKKKSARNVNLRYASFGSMLDEIVAFASKLAEHQTAKCFNENPNETEDHENADQ